MDAVTLYNLLKPHLEIMDTNEKESLSSLIMGVQEKKSSRNKRRISLTKAKEKLKYFRNRAAKVEQEKISL